MANSTRMLFFTLFKLAEAFISPHAFHIIRILQTLQRILVIVH